MKIIKVTRILGKYVELSNPLSSGYALEISLCKIFPDLTHFFADTINIQCALRITTYSFFYV